MEQSITLTRISLWYNFWLCNKPNNAFTDKGTQSSYWWCRLYKGERPSGWIRDDIEEGSDDEG